MTILAKTFFAGKNYFSKPGFAMEKNVFSTVWQKPAKLGRMPRLKTVFRERAFSHAGPAVWNSLPVFIQASKTLHPSASS